MTLDVDIINILEKVERELSLLKVKLYSVEFYERESEG